MGRYVASLMSVALLVICVAHFVSNSSMWSGGVARANLTHLSGALAALDRDCGISAVQPGLHTLHFLTKSYPSVDDLAGFKLAQSQCWAGPYIKTIPTMQGYPYELLVVDQGMFIVPARGVQLPSGFVIGERLVWSASADVRAMMKADGILSYDGEPLAREITFAHEDSQEGQIAPGAHELLSSVLH